MTDDDKEQFQLDRARLHKLFDDLEHGERGFDVAAAKLKSLRDGLTEKTRRETARGLISWVGSFLQVIERFVLVPSQARLEAIIVESIELESEDAFQIALENRLDFMNGRAALVDRWRLIQVDADALQSIVNITASGDLRTAPLIEPAIVATILLRHRQGTGCRCASELERQYPAALIPANLMVAEVSP